MVKYDTSQYYDPHENQKKTYSVSSRLIPSKTYEPGVIDNLSEIYFVNAKSGLNVRDNNSLDGNKIGGLPYGSLVYIAEENQGELIVNDTDPETGEKKQIYDLYQIQPLKTNNGPCFCYCFLSSL